MKLEPDRIRLAEHFALHSPLPLEELCHAPRQCFGLSEFEYGSENEGEWGLVLHERVEYNVSRPYQQGTLQEWDNSVPAGCNIGLTLSVSTDSPEPRAAGQSLTALVPRIGQALADLLGQPIHHHRTWLGPGMNITRSHVIRPGAQGEH